MGIQANTIDSKGGDLENGRSPTANLVCVYVRWFVSWSSIKVRSSYDSIYQLWNFYGSAEWSRRKVYKV